MSLAPKVEPAVQHSSQKVDPVSDGEDGDKAGCQGDIQPVGHDYVEEVWWIRLINKCVVFNEVFVSWRFLPKLESETCLFIFK